VTTAPPRQTRSRRRGLILALLIVAGIVALGVGVVFGIRFIQSALAPHPSPGIPLTVVAESKAAEAAGSATAGSEEAAAASYLAAQPTAVWLTPEQEPIGTVGTRVAELAAQARTQESTLVIVVYGLPERDCGNYSAGGLAPGDYEIWTTQIGDALRAADDVRAIVIVEPDSLALAPECGNVSERVMQLRAAVEDLAAPTTWLYVDGGHSNWLPATQMADLIRQVDDGARIRGFATNTSNYNDLVAEFAYAHELSALLDGLHAVVDSGRSGAGSDGQWCNPAGRLIGDDPGTLGDDVVDVNLWIKPPGESDGPCNGGPAAGAWWPQAAIELTRERIG
jgi:endoglucanase